MQRTHSHTFAQIARLLILIVFTFNVIPGKYTHTRAFMCVCESCAQSYSSFLFFAYRAHSAHNACRTERAAMQRERERFRRESASAAEGKRSCLPNMAERTKAAAAEQIGKAWRGTARKDDAMHCVCMRVCVCSPKIALAKEWLKKVAE